MTFRKDVMQHSGPQTRDKIELEKLPDGVVKGAGRTASIDGFIGCLSRKTKKVATLEEIEAATAEGSASET